MMGKHFYVAQLTWIPVTEQLPEPETPVLVCAIENRQRPPGTRCVWSRASWIPRFHKLDMCDYEGDDLDYDEGSDDGESYWPEGWYEWNNYEETHWRIDAEVTHWLPVALPEMDEAQAKT